MNREIQAALSSWKASPHRKPLLLRGARQTGKTFTLKAFGQATYQRCHYFNFEEDARLASLFTRDLEPARILAQLGLYRRTDIKQGEDLIIFDEIQACNDALNSLKYFNERANHHHIAAAGSLLGVSLSGPSSFPVGQVDFLDLYPMTFYEFLEAMGQERYRSYLETITAIEPLPEVLHLELIDLLQRYYFTGGMPEAVSRLAGGASPTEIRRVQRAILDSYTLDFAKHAPTSDIPKLILLWESLPAQLGRENNKFIFSLARKGARAREYENALTWLLGAGVIHRSTLVTSPKLPLKAYRNASSFKIYACDVGLLGALADTPVEVLPGDQSILTEYHGAFVENYVAQHLKAMGHDALYYWKNRLS